VADTYLICEGEENSLDIRILDKIIAQYYDKNVQILPAFGTGGLQKIAEYFRNRYGTCVFTIQDRDYCTRQESDRSWSSGKSHLMLPQL
jgi:hypothetical protein